MALDMIGKPENRVDGRKKVTGEARYADEFHFPNLLHGAVVNSSIAKGKIIEIDTTQALRQEGVIHIITHENRPSLSYYDDNYQDMDAPPGSPFRPLYDNEIQFNLQPVALVVAETTEIARYAASLVQVTYEQYDHDSGFDKQLKRAYVPKEYKSIPPPDPWGNPDRAFEEAPYRISESYSHPAQHHNPIELHASTVHWEGNGKITVYDKIQGAINSQEYIMGVFGLRKEDVRVLSPFVGGAFGSGLRPQYQLFLATMAALELKRSVRVVLTRQQMFSFGHRPHTVQRLSLSANEEGKLQAIKHEAFGETSRFEDYSENVIIWPGILYACENVKLSHQLVPLDAYTPLDMRAPGGASGIFALECAMDELSYKVNLDPIDLRLINYTDMDQIEGKPFSSKELKECLRQGAERFGWKDRKPAPRSMKEGNQLVGWGMACGAWEAKQKPASAKAVLSSEGKLTISSATADIGTGTYTIMSGLAAGLLGLDIDMVDFLLGDTDLPKAPMQGGSSTASSVGSAVKLVCDQLGKKILTLAEQMPNSLFLQKSFDEVFFDDAAIKLKSDPAILLPYSRILDYHQLEILETEVDSTPAGIQEKYSSYTHSAVFAEVKVDKDLGTIQVTRMISAIAAGNILNSKTARSQILGGMVWGIGMAMQEYSMMDPAYGRFINHDLAEYHVPVNADILEHEVLFIAEQDDIVNPIGAKGLGEIGVVAVAPAIANAIFHATGIRVRDLPITLDKVMG